VKRKKKHLEFQSIADALEAFGRDEITLAQLDEVARRAVESEANPDPNRTMKE
jgi:hypothetical protein